MLELRIFKSFGGFELSLELEFDGSCLALVGENGSGKSTTLRCIAGLETPERGRIAVAGRVVFDSELGVNLPPQKRSVGYVPQGLELFPHMSVYENVAFGLRVRGICRAEVERRVSEAIEMLGLSGLERRGIAQLSGGQRQRVALARALVIEPELLLLDEPFSALDAATKRSLLPELRRLLEDAGIPAVVVSHDRSEVEALRARVVELRGGRVVSRSRLAMMEATA